MVIMLNSYHLTCIRPGGLEVACLLHMGKVPGSSPGGSQNRPFCNFHPKMAGNSNWVCRTWNKGHPHGKIQNGVCSRKESHTLNQILIDISERGIRIIKIQNSIVLFVKSLSRKSYTCKNTLKGFITGKKKNHKLPIWMNKNQNKKNGNKLWKYNFFTAFIDLICLLITKPQRPQNAFLALVVLSSRLKS